MSAEVLRYAAFTDSARGRPTGTAPGGRGPSAPGGNPAGVVLDATRLSDGQMLAIAEAIGYSETAFVTTTDRDSHRLRFFSPRAEVAFCGHATIATAVAMAERYGPGPLEFSTPAGQVTVLTTIDDGQISATLTSPPSHTRPVDEDVLVTALRVLGWTSDEVHPGYPPHVAYAGNDHLVLAAATFDRLADLDYDYPGLDDLMARQGWTTVCLFHPDQTPDVFHVRNPFPPGGVVEDPATGAAAAALGGYLRDLGLVPVPGRLTLLQGQHMGSPSRIIVDLDPNVHTVAVTGTATRLALSPYDDLELL